LTVVLAGVVFAVLTVLSFVLPRALGSKPAMARNVPTGVAYGAGLPAGSSVPAFSETNLLTGRPITSASVYGTRTLLFFSEGVMCQSCLQQIKDIGRLGGQLEELGVQLVSITPDSPSELEQAAQQYGITSPLISDSNLDMSEAFNTIGQGMHSTTPGHAFVLIFRGKVLWYRDFWLPPTRTMYVQPHQLLSDVERSLVSSA
jgi:peroxiredoxin Q/BCP